MVKKRTNPHKPFMVFNAFLFIAVLAVTGIFLYMAYTFKRDAQRKKTYEGSYRIELSPDFAGKSLSIHINDSLLMDGIMPDTAVVFHLHRFADEHMLMIVDKQTDNAIPFNLSKEGGQIQVKKQGSEIVFEEKRQ